MNRFLTFIILTSCLILSSPVLASDVAPNPEDPLMVYRSSEVAGPFFNNSYGYAFFPTVGKGGIGIGGAYGQGQVYRNGRITGTASLYKLSIGFQLGGQVFSEIIFFKDKHAYDEFVNGGFELDASASAVAITAGAQATTGTAGSSAGVSVGTHSDRQLGGEYRNGSAIFIHTKGGLMYEASVGGQKFTYRPLIN
ncbi:YSC84-related protein [Geopsychrobacter electrodiphilus]|uniref:YSC84-related protein n=1 Tax=Geopsychrobacter electrodiphilus TaxID=225196 RepID=UPI00036722A8|nr:YSC84-related protein [Geopsychrobacter electrodiphilus]